MRSSFVHTAVTLTFVGSALSSIFVPNSIEKRAVVVPNTLPGTWKYQGCYTENGPRTLSGPGTTSNTLMTAEYCIAFCESQKMIYAGTEYSSECCKSSKLPNVDTRTLH
jgi:hypothetical protein